MLTERSAGSALLLLLISASSVADLTPAEESYVVADGKVDQGTYIGWQVFQENCARCHGPGATGTELAPNLTERINWLSPDQFRLRVLNRYFITIPLDEVVAEGSANKIGRASCRERV